MRLLIYLMNCSWKINNNLKRFVESKKKNIIRYKVIKINYNNCVGKYRIMKIKLMNYKKKIYIF